MEKLGRRTLTYLWVHCRTKKEEGTVLKRDSVVPETERTTEENGDEMSNKVPREACPLYLLIAQPFVS